MTTIVPAHTAGQIAALPAASREMAVTAYLVDAHDRLSLAVQATGPEAVASLKAEVATAAEATRQLGLSREIQSDAQEMVRRCEYALGKAIRAGQDAGLYAKRGDVGGGHRPGVPGAVAGDRRSRSDDLASTADFFKHGDERQGVYAMADGATDEQFEQALTEAREEGNLSRANVVRKIKDQASPKRTRTQLADEIAALAEKGNAAAQIGRLLGHGEGWIKRTAKEFGVDIPADRLIGKTRRVDSVRVAREAVMTLDGLASTVDLVSDLTGLDPSEAQQWTASLDQSIRALNRLNKKIKEAVL